MIGPALSPHENALRLPELLLPELRLPELRLPELLLPELLLRLVERFWVRVAIETSLAWSRAKRSGRGPRSCCETLSGHRSARRVRGRSRALRAEAAERRRCWPALREPAH